MEKVMEHKREQTTARSFEKVLAILDANGRNAARLIPILQAIQDEYRYLPQEVLAFVAMDVVIDPFNSSRIFVSHGQLNTTPDPGIYRSTDGGASWTLLGGGLPTTNFGRTPLAIYATSSTQRTIYAGVSAASTRAVVGLYRSTNAGASWTKLNSALRTLQDFDRPLPNIRIFVV